MQAENAQLLGAARLRDGSLSLQLGELQTRSLAAEQHAQQLASTVGSATAPLLRHLLLERRRLAAALGGERSLQRGALLLVQIVVLVEHHDAAERVAARWCRAAAAFQ